MVRIKVKKYIPYPELTDKKFQLKIFQKKEFYENRIKKRKNREKLCPGTKTEFNLAPHQKFLKNYLSVDTPYNGILIFHGTGTGKTCAAVSIAENFKTFVRRSKKKILVLSSKSLKQNFINTIYNLDKEELKNNKTDIVQCTGNEYMLHESDRALTKIQKLRKIKRNINTFYQFMGYGRFANDVMRKTGWNGREKDLTPEIRQILKREFSNRVIIIDEVHNIKKKYFRRARKKSTCNTSSCSEYSK